MLEKNATSLIKGGGFLLEPLGTHDHYIPEEASDDERQLAKLANDFAAKEVMARSTDIEAAKPGVAASLLKKAGELGLLMGEIPPEYGGMGLGRVSTTYISENTTHQGSFSVAFMCHTGIATLPVMAYGTHAQKEKYLTKLATGEFLGAYALTEPGAGSDALSGRTKAVLSDDKKFYVLNGEKIFVTNGGFADLFTLFAKIDGDKFTAFLVERNFPGIAVGPEERKMGIHGSSTVPLTLTDAQVPVENVLGEIGKGHRIAFNVLNVGRWKLGAACVGGCKRLIERSSVYVQERQQFGKPIASFQMIRDKIATCTIATYLTESLVYRFASMIDAAVHEIDPKDPSYQTKRQDVLKEYAIEASIAKVFGSEALQKAADESVQMFGGYGFCEDYGVERFYRDARINRIFEGTNEINEIIITGNLLKRAMKGELPLMEKLQNILAELKSGIADVSGDHPLKQEVDAVERLKRLVVYVAGVGLQKYADTFEEQQVVSAFIADVIIETFALESGVYRAEKIIQKFGAEKAKIPIAICRAAVAEKAGELFDRASQILMNIADADAATFGPYKKALERLTPTLMTNTATHREMIAARILEKKGYDLGSLPVRQAG